MDAIFMAGNTVLVWSDFVNAATGSAITNATVAGKLTTLSSTAAISSCTMSYDTDLEAYTGSLTTLSSSGANLVTEGTEYFVIVTASLGSTKATKKRRVVAKYDVFDE